MASKGEQATLYRMVMEDHLCPFGSKTRDLLKREGYAVADHWLTTSFSRADIDPQRR